jgi:hypothetical protein
MLGDFVLSFAAHVTHNSSVYSNCSVGVRAPTVTRDTPVSATREGSNTTKARSRDSELFALDQRAMILLTQASGKTAQLQ